jgi:hypothetical protein
MHHHPKKGGTIELRWRKKKKEKEKEKEKGSFKPP